MPPSLWIARNRFTDNFGKIPILSVPKKMSYRENPKTVKIICTKNALRGFWERQFYRENKGFPILRCNSVRNRSFLESEREKNYR